ncbi:MAG: hypothetical protein ABW007_16315 [Chitinophagaceae bacterium]
MAALVWDLVGERFYETGIDHGVLYMPDESGVYATGVAWNGLTSVSETPTGAEANAQYADNIKYLNLISVEEFGATLEAFTYPDEFAQFDGLGVPSPGVFVGQQPRKTFGLSYRTRIGNDLEGDGFGYKLHLVYGCIASPSEKAYNTINDSPEAITFSWEISTTPVPVTGFKPTSLIVVDSSDVDASMLANLETQLYGGASLEPTLPLPDDVIAIFGGGGAPLATGATAGIPGTWTPGGSTPPSDVASLIASSITATPNTAWTTGQFVQTGTAGAPGQGYWNGTAWVAGTAS